MEDTARAEVEDAVPEAVFDRKLLFVSARADSVVLVPWFFRARVRSDSVHRSSVAWLSREERWEILSEEALRTPPSRSPGRLVPGEHTRLIVGAGDALEALVLRNPPRELELRPGELVTEWAGPGGEAVRLFRSRTLFPAGELEGILLDFSRSWEAPGGEPGDWIYLQSDGDFHLFLEELRPLEEPRLPARFRAWSRAAVRDTRWPEVAVDWTETRAFEQARRDIPAKWRITTPGGEIEGELEVVTSHLTAGEGPGPVLPIAALFQVAGAVRLDGEEFPVSGVVRHVQR